MSFLIVKVSFFSNNFIIGYEEICMALEHEDDDWVERYDDIWLVVGTIYMHKGNNKM